MRLHGANLFRLGEETRQTDGPWPYASLTEREQLDEPNGVPFILNMRSLSGEKGFEERRKWKTITLSFLTLCSNLARELDKVAVFRMAVAHMRSLTGEGMTRIAT